MAPSTDFAPTLDLLHSIARSRETRRRIGRVIGRAPMAVSWPASALVTAGSAGRRGGPRVGRGGRPRPAIGRNPSGSFRPPEPIVPWEMAATPPDGVFERYRSVLEGVTGGDRVIEVTG